MKKNLKLIPIISGILLLLAIGSLPYGYYQFLRLAVCASGAWMAYEFNKSEHFGLMIVFGVVALVFNPVVPVYLDKGTWVLIDLLAASLFFYSSRKVKNE